MTQYGEMLGGARVKYNETSSPNYEIKSNNTHQQDGTTFSDISQYGEILESGDQSKENLYNEFDNYFNHPVMVKIKDVNNYSMYMCKTYCLLSNECRYIVVFVPQDNMPEKSKENLATMRWVSLQTRTLSDHHELPPHSYQPKRHPGLNYAIDRVNVSEDCSTYKCDHLPLTVTLLHGKNKPDDYQKKGTIIAALETYQTILTLTQ
jgi:hypothetical protein